MIRGAAELNKMLGFYALKTSSKGKDEAAEEEIHKPNTLMSDDELISVTKPVITRDRTTDQIPLIKDKYMAYQYRLSNLPGRTVKLRRVLKHPNFIKPDGTTSTGSDFTIKKKLEHGEVFAYDAYAFYEDYEMVEGEWVFQIWYKDIKLIEQSFATYWPDETKGTKGAI